MKNFVPKPYKNLNISVRIDFKRLELIDSLAEKYNLSRSGFINQCIDFAIENMGQPEEE